MERQILYTYIFLDVDGVLNNKDHYYKQHKKYGGRFCCQDMPFNPRSLKNLKKIVTKTNAKIILTSSWRRSEHCMTVLEARFAEYGLKVSSKTPHINGNRGQEIDQWLKENAPAEKTILFSKPDFYGISREIYVPKYNFIIIDDEKYDISNRFDTLQCVWCDYNKGLTFFKTLEALDKLLLQKEVWKTCQK